MRLLIVTYRLPVYSGDAPSNTVFNLVKFLSRRHRVTLLGLATHPVPAQAKERLLQYCHRVEAVEWPRWRAAFSAARGLASREPLQMWYYRSAEFSDLVTRVIAEEKIDLALGYHLRSGQFLSDLDSIPRVIAIQPAQALHFGRRYKLTHNPVLRALYRLETDRLVGYEATLAEKFDSCLLISSKDRDAIDPNHRLKNVFFNPHGTDIHSFAPPANTIRDVNTLVFCGSMRMDTNSNAVLQFHRSILPLIWAKRPETKFLIVGKNPPRSVMKLAKDRRITVTGTVPDVRPFLWKAAVGIDPIRMAAGMQNKLIEGLAAGLPMVITEEANEGIQAPVGRAVLVGNTAEEFAAHVLTLLGNPAQAKALAAEGLAFVQAQWSWEHHFRSLEDKLESLTSCRQYASG
jgi:polysaccharide biosynthesis protein PslH